jgi:hypothetical protein
MLLNKTKASSRNSRTREYPGSRKPFTLLNHMKLYKKIIFGLAALSLFFVLTATAAEPARVYLERVGNFGVRILIDTANRPVNAYDVEVTYNADIADIESVDTSRSIVTVLPQPIKAAAGKIIIKGGSTSAFTGSAGELATVTLAPVAEGIVQFEVKKAVAYIADGSGAPLALAPGSLPLRVTQASFAVYQQSKVVASKGDVVAPSITVAAIEDNPLHYGERLLVFQGSDTGTGVAKYEARDRSWLLWSDWREAVNPYPVDRGVWAIQLRAIDNNGNATLATIYQFGAAIWKAVLGLIIIAVVLGGLFTVRKKRSVV